MDILELVAELAAGGAGVLLIVHDLTLAAAYCDRVVTLLPHPASGAPVVTPSRLES